MRPTRYAVVGCVLTACAGAVDLPPAYAPARPTAQLAAVVIDGWSNAHVAPRLTVFGEQGGVAAHCTIDHASRVADMTCTPSVLAVGRELDFEFSVVDGPHVYRTIEIPEDARTVLAVMALTRTIDEEDSLAARIDVHRTDALPGAELAWDGETITIDNRSGVELLVPPVLSTFDPLLESTTRGGIWTNVPLRLAVRAASVSSAIELAAIDPGAALAARHPTLMSRSLDSTWTPQPDAQYRARVPVAVPRVDDDHPSTHVPITFDSSGDYASTVYVADVYDLYLEPARPERWISDWPGSR